MFANYASFLLFPDQGRNGLFQRNDGKMLIPLIFTAFYIT